MVGISKHMAAPGMTSINLPIAPSETGNRAQRRAMMALNRAAHKRAAKHVATNLRAANEITEVASTIHEC